MKKVFSTYAALLSGHARAKGVLHTLRQAMGFIPKSENGRQLLNTREEPSEEALKEISELNAKKREVQAQLATYTRRLEVLMPPRVDSNQGTLDFAAPSEMLFSYPTVDREANKLPMKVDRMSHFNNIKGLKATYDKTTRVNLAIKVTETEYTVETLEDPYTGKRVRASMLEVGPEQFQLTWMAIGNLVKMHVGFAIPMNRLELMLSQPEFTSSKMCRVFEYLVENIHPVYLELAIQLAQVKIMWGDDTDTKVIELYEVNENSFACKIDEKLGWISEKADGSGSKKNLNVSLLMGKTDVDPRSTIRFFRTHTGNLGNLITKVLAFRKKESGQLIFQGDLSNANLPTAELRELYKLLIAGCGAHARRPFWKLRDSDPDLCYYMLSGFLMLGHIERLIDNKGRNRENILKYRGRYGKMIWQALKNRCEASISGRSVGRFGVRNNDKLLQWAPGMKLHQACNYVIKNYEALTRYLENPYLLYTNNTCERALRIEKCMLDSSKFRKTRKGRAV
ncbi:MAG: transposase, partial [Candidatus Magasanikbacteria bacterium]|nr:transposase [Candidatus Magasanikbacteria bacterium]